jgi:nucleoside 2-deoxyribosyltransferase
MFIYIAAPLFSTAEKDFNARLATKLEDAGFEVFLPQRDSAYAKESSYTKMPKDERRVTMFELDRDQIIGSDVFLYVLDGRVPDEGAAVQLGIAYMDKVANAKDMHLVGLHTDQRAAFEGAPLNPVLRVPLEHVAEDEEQLIAYLKSLPTDKK